MKPSRVAVIVTVASLAGGLVATAANAAFTDVRPENQFAEHIANVQEAGIATGFADGSFRPTAALSRQQAAAWLDRAASRGALDFSDQVGEYTPLTPQATTRQLATVEVGSHAATGGSGWVMLQGYVAAAARAEDGAGCPCALNIRILDGAGDVVAISALTVSGPNEDDERDYAGPASSAPMMAAVPLPGGAADTFTLEVELVDSDVAQVLVGGSLFGQYVPMAEGDPTQLGQATLAPTEPFAP